MDIVEQVSRQRAQIVERIAQLGGMRMGSICEQTLAGKRADGSRVERGPYATYTFKRDGRTVGRRLVSEREKRLYRRADRHISPVPALERRAGGGQPAFGGPGGGGRVGRVKKKLQELIEAEAQAEAARIVERVRRAGRLDLDAVELSVRTAMLGAGARVLEQLLQGTGVGRRHSPPVCARGHLARKMQSRGVREKTLHTIVGPVRWKRSRHVCPECGAVEYAGDELLGLHGGGFSPGMRRLMTRAGGRESFAEAAEDLRVYGAIRVGAKDIERVSEDVGRQIDTWMRREASRAVMTPDTRGPAAGEQIPMLYIALDGTGVPMRKGELAAHQRQGARRAGHHARGQARLLLHPDAR